MIIIYTKKLHLRNKLVIEDADLFFDDYMSMEMLTDEDKLAIQTIDKKSATELYHLSTGCKTIILLMHLKNSYIVYVESLEENCIDYILENLDDISIYCEYIFSFISRIKNENLQKKIVYNDNLKLTEKNLNDFYYLR